MAKPKKSGPPAPAASPATNSNPPAKHGGVLESIADWAKAKTPWIVGIAILLIVVTVHFTGTTKRVVKKKEVPGSPSAQTSSPDETVEGGGVTNYGLVQVIKTEVKEPAITIKWKDVEAPYGKWGPVHGEIEGYHWDIKNNEDRVLIRGNENDARMYLAVTKMDDQGRVVFDEKGRQVYIHYLSNENGDKVQEIPGIPDDVYKMEFMALKRGGITIRLGISPLQQ